jgi:hypothetical protein
MKAKVGTKVMLKDGSIGIVVRKYKEPLGWYYLYNVEVNGKVYTLKHVYPIND